jgi:hypothetical protein
VQRRALVAVDARRDAELERRELRRRADDLGMLNVERYGAPPAGCETSGAPERMPTVPEWWPRSSPEVIVVPETTLTYSFTPAVASGMSEGLGVQAEPVSCGVQRSGLTPLPQKKTPRRFGMAPPSA